LIFESKKYARSFEQRNFTRRNSCFGGAVLASANRKAKELGVDVQTSLITTRPAFDERRLAVARALRRAGLRWAAI